jgi:excisionase family DNA binding protein
MLTIEEVAKHWRLRPATVRLRIKSGELAAVRVGGRYRTNWHDVWSCEAGRMPTGARADEYKTPLLTKSDLARAMKVGTRTVERWLFDGLPTRCVGENVRLNRAEAARWIQRRFGIDVRDLLDRLP